MCVYVCVCVRMCECVCLPFFLSLGALTFPCIGYTTESLLKKIMLLILFFSVFRKGKHMGQFNGGNKLL